MIENYSQLPKNINIINNNEEITFNFNNIPLTVKQNEEVSLKIDTSEELAKLYKQLKDLNLSIQEDSNVLNINGYYNISFLQKVTNNNMLNMLKNGQDKIIDYIKINPFYQYVFNTYPKQYDDQISNEKKLKQSLIFGTLDLDKEFNNIVSYYRCFIELNMAYDNILNTAYFIYVDEESINKAIEVGFVDERPEGFTQDGWYLYNQEQKNIEFVDIEQVNELLKNYYINLQQILFFNDYNDMQFKPLSTSVSVDSLNDIVNISLEEQSIDFALWEAREDPEGFYEVIRSSLYNTPLAKIRVINIQGNISFETDWDLNNYLSFTFDDKDGCYNLNFNEENVGLIPTGRISSMVFTIKADNKIVYSQQYNILFNEIL